MLRASLYPREEARSKRNTSTRGTVIWVQGAVLPDSSHVQPFYSVPRFSSPALRQFTAPSGSWEISFFPIFHLRQYLYSGNDRRRARSSSTA